MIRAALLLMICITLALVVVITYSEGQRSVRRATRVVVFDAEHSFGPFMGQCHFFLCDKHKYAICPVDTADDNLSGLIEWNTK